MGEIKEGLDKVWEAGEDGYEFGKEHLGPVSDAWGNAAADQIQDLATVLSWAQLAAAFAVLYLGTVVTGAGPHAGDAGRDATKYRNGLSPLQTAQLHTDVVFLLVGLTLALLITQRTPAVMALVAAEVANAVIGFVQYFTHLPVILVGIHMLGAALVAACSTWVLLDNARVEAAVVSE